MNIMKAATGRTCLLLWLVLIGLLSSGCSWLGGSDTTLKPAELQAIANPIKIRQLWESDVGSGNGGTFLKLTPAVLEDRAYAAGHDGEVVALAAASGQVLWSVKTGLKITAGVGVGEGLVLVASGKGEVLALRADNGQEAWRAQVSSEVLASPRAAFGVVAVRSGDGKFTLFDARSGVSRGVPYSYTVPPLTLRGTAAPLLVQGYLIAGLDTGKVLMLPLQAAGKAVELPIAQGRGRTELDRMVDIDTEPRIFDNVLYVAAYQGNVTALDLRNGNTQWTRDFSSHNGLDVDRNQVYIADDSDAVWSLDRRTGGTLWKQTELAGRKLTTPVASGGYVVVADYEGYIHWLDATSGRVAGRMRVDKAAVLAAPVVAGATVYALSSEGTLAAFQAD